MARLLESARLRFGAFVRRTVGDGRGVLCRAGPFAASPPGEPALPAAPDLSDLEPPPEPTPDHSLEL